MNDTMIDPARVRDMLSDLDVMTATADRTLRAVAESVTGFAGGLRKFHDTHGATIEQLHDQSSAAARPHPVHVLIPREAFDDDPQPDDPMESEAGVQVGRVVGTLPNGLVEVAIDDPAVASVLAGDSGAFTVKVATAPQPVGRMDADRMVESLAKFGRAVRERREREEQAARDSMLRVESTLRDMRRGPIPFPTTPPKGVTFHPADDAFTDDERAAFDAVTLPDLPDSVSRVNGAQFTSDLRGILDRVVIDADDESGTHAWNRLASLVGLSSPVQA